MKGKLFECKINVFSFCRILKEGSVLSNGLYEGCGLTLLPHVESGLIVSYLNLINTFIFYSNH